MRGQLSRPVLMGPGRSNPARLPDRSGRKLPDMCIVCYSARWTKAERFVELGRCGILGTKMEIVEPASGCFNDLCDQALAHSEPSKR